MGFVPASNFKFERKRSSIITRDNKNNKIRKFMMLYETPNNDVLRQNFKLLVMNNRT